MTTTTTSDSTEARRICSLLPGATEVIALLGLADRLVGVSHECDFPPEVTHKTVMVEAVLTGDAASGAIDRDVRDAVANDRPLYRLKEDLLRAARPDIVIAQQLCHVCAITPGQIQRAISTLVPPPRLLALNPTTIDEVIADIVRIGEAVGRANEGRALAASLRAQLTAVGDQTRRSSSRPRVVCVEWLDPLYIAGHWIPEMVSAAGGQDVMGRAGAASRRASWDDLIAAAPDVLIIMPCGFTVARTLEEAHLLTGHAGWSRLPAVRADRVFLVEAGAYFSRPGPRLIEGVKILASLIHPDRTGGIVHPGARHFDTRIHSDEGRRAAH